MKRPVLIAGPTVSGKSALAMALAAREDCCIINADALQVYDGWRILTARPEVGDENTVPHRLFGTVSRHAAYSVGDWLRDIGGVLDECREKDMRPIIVGGTGLYFSALTGGLSEIPPIPRNIRDRANDIRTDLGPAGFVRDLERDDPETLARLDQNNPMRLQRAWEVFSATGRGLSDWQTEILTPLIPLDGAEAVVLCAEPAWLNPRIELRLEQMLTQGVLAECAAALAGGWSPDRPSARALGAAEFIAHIQGHIPLDEAVAKTVIRTRQYAKRQRTWFRGRMGDWRQLDAASGAASLASRIE